MGVPGQSRLHAVFAFCWALWGCHPSFLPFFNVLKDHLHATAEISISKSRARPAGIPEIPVFKVLVLM